MTLIPAVGRVEAAREEAARGLEETATEEGEQANVDDWRTRVRPKFEATRKVLGAAGQAVRKTRDAMAMATMAVVETAMAVEEMAKAADVMVVMSTGRRPARRWGCSRQHCRVPCRRSFVCHRGCQRSSPSASLGLLLLL